ASFTAKFMGGTNTLTFDGAKNLYIGNAGKAFVTVDGSSTTFSSNTAVQIGSGTAVDSTFTVSGGAEVSVAAGTALGTHVDSSGNLLTVTGANSSFSVGTIFQIGNVGDNNQAVV